MNQIAAESTRVKTSVVLKVKGHKMFTEDAGHRTREKRVGFYTYVFGEIANG